jgi:hypothetical protein
MRLINVHTLELEWFGGRTKPEYAILSHTWEEEEVIMAEMIEASKSPESTVRQKKGFAKILKSCEITKGFGYNYIWVDTCGIDKSSSAELTEAINSMFKFYHQSAVCIVWLSDLKAHDDLVKDLGSCRWFTRGWTLQELIAPKNLILFDQTWNRRGSKEECADILSGITRVSDYILKPEPGSDLQSQLRDVHVATKLNWASHRQTTREEDEAYCLMGLFEIHMPMLYGEGNNAFRRLQEEIVRKSNDLSLFAWYPPDGEVGKKRNWSICKIS